ncbi:ABC transporter ATP-binding protein [Amycolatopsis anabasis]|uniref:ABC transporter ATP-binding protein n=1 Tax=Amycolatopsis anabasis TaxID=1840409 RepID=UPI00131BF23C|nr:ABC transporter ATP-binding protein [Amycolatopsis anabasis]
MTDPILEATGLGLRYRRNWALRDCSLAVPRGRVVALVGPNGAGKTTLLHLVVGLLAPTRGSVRVLGEPGRDALERVAFMAQDKPLYDRFTVEDMLTLGRRMNPRWDGAAARRRLDALGIPLNRKVNKLSTGQQAQVALTCAVAKRPELLVLDEPLANLDPLARHDVMRGLMEAVAETELTVLLSSHVVADLENTCDWLIVLSGGRVQVSGDIDELLAAHRLLTGPAAEADAVAARTTVIDDRRTGRQATLLLRTGESAPLLLSPQWTECPVGLEELVLGYLRRPDAATLPRPALATPART